MSRIAENFGLGDLPSAIVSTIVNRCMLALIKACLGVLLAPSWAFANAPVAVYEVDSSETGPALNLWKSFARSKAPDWSDSGLSKARPPEKAKGLKRLTTEFAGSGLLLEAFSFSPNLCRPAVSCLDTACKYSGDCGFSSNLHRLIGLCKGSDGECVEFACQYSRDCSFDSDLDKIILMCRQSNGACVEAACRYSGDCGFEADLEKLIKLCDGSDGACVDAACRYSGDCGFDSDLENIIKACK